MPGYARCPKCRKPLPRRAPTVVQGGTAVEEKSRGPLIRVIALGVGTIAASACFATRGGGDKPAAPPTVAPAPEQQAEPDQTDTPVPFADDGPRPEQPTGPDPATVGKNLERDLKRQRLWSTVTVNGNRVEVRSGSCSDPAMGPLLDASAPDFRAAGVTRMRCVEQSGRVVSDREL
jgi:hypothetical protein